MGLLDQPYNQSPRDPKKPRVLNRDGKAPKKKQTVLEANRPSPRQCKIHRVQVCRILVKDTAMKTDKKSNVESVAPKHTKTKPQDCPTYYANPRVRGPKKTRSKKPQDE